MWYAKLVGNYKDDEWSPVEYLDCKGIKEVCERIEYHLKMNTYQQDLRPKKPSEFEIQNSIVNYVKQNCSCSKPD